RFHFRFGLADHRLGHQRRRGLRYGAALSNEADVAHHTAFRLHIYRQLIAAQRVMALRDMIGVFHFMEITRTAIVIEDDFLIELTQFVLHIPHRCGSPRNIACALRRPATSSSTSRSSLYNAKDARAVPAMP